MAVLVLGAKIHDPQETRYYTFDWTTHLGTDTVTEAAVAATPAGLTLSAASLDATARKVNVSIAGGTANADYIVTCTITTATGEILERSGLLQVRDL